MPPSKEVFFDVSLADMKAALSSSDKNTHLIIQIKRDFFKIIGGVLSKIAKLPNGQIFFLDMSAVPLNFIKVLFDPRENINFQFRLTDKKLYQIQNKTVVPVK